jgi:hypothetical protein
VVLDTEGGPSEARVVTGHWAMVNRYGAVAAGGSLSDRLCTTPCVASLPYGTYSLQFIGLADNERVGTASVVFAQSPSVYRYALGLQRTHLGVRWLASAAVTLGAISVGTGVAMGTGSKGFGDVPIGLTLGGLVALVGGIVVLALNPVELQEGAGVQFAMPANQ